MRGIAVSVMRAPRPHVGCRGESTLTVGAFVTIKNTLQLLIRSGLVYG